MGVLIYRNGADLFRVVLFVAPLAIAAELKIVNL